ncbi:hypothetical protein Vretimale_12130 [Volvox reticuliferus]|uniref:Uncharacterized protein n=1 Tax=Volvox reticuliferus TaxID=1737510 RepID=A0A8J4GIU8_9CHLO|nr:hypothetical protein Vretimale_12130 [Volvox reticuliferus]
MAPVGSVFPVDFWVWDADYVNTSVTRYVEITDPCPRPNGGSQRYRLCKDLHNTLYCSPLPCDRANAMRPPYYEPPSLALLSDVVYVEYGSVPPYYLGPCASLPHAKTTNTTTDDYDYGNDTADFSAVQDDTAAGYYCGAYALTRARYSNGRVVPIDLTNDIDVRPMIDCTATNGTNTTAAADGGTTDATLCRACPLDLMHLPGGCLPGAYYYIFSVSNGINSTDKVLTVQVYYKTSVRGYVSPFPPYDNYAFAVEDADNINTAIRQVENVGATDTWLYGWLVSFISDSLELADVQDSDVVPRKAWVAQLLGVTGVSVLVDVEVHIHAPNAVHMGLIRNYLIYVSAMTTNASFLVSELSTKLGFDLRAHSQASNVAQKVTGTSSSVNGSSRRSQLELRKETDNKCYRNAQGCGCPFAMAFRGIGSIFGID